MSSMMYSKFQLCCAAVSLNSFKGFSDFEALQHGRPHLNSFSEICLKFQFFSLKKPLEEQGGEGVGGRKRRKKHPKHYAAVIILLQQI